MQTRLDALRKIYRDYPRAFWIYNIVVFIDRFGGFMLYPFIALYLTHRFNIGMTTVGIVFAIFATSGFIGTPLGGALSDRFGRKGVIAFSLVFSALSALAMAFSPTLEIFMAISVVVGILSSIGHPAHEAVVADLLPEDKRAEGYGIVRVVFNLAVVAAPATAGLLIANSYLLLFIVDAAISLLAALFVLFALPETKPQTGKDVQAESMAQTFGGYGQIYRDTPFIAFVFVCVMMTLVYMNMNTTLGVFLRDQHGIPESGYGLLISLNAILVVLFQIWLTRRLGKNKPMLMMALGTAFYAVGFATYGFVSSYLMFAVAMIVITIGEMILAPFQQALVASFAPEDMRGRYMAIAGLSWGLAFAIGPFLAGLIIENVGPNWLWYACGILGMLATVGYLILHKVYRSSVPIAVGSAATD